MAKIVFYKGQFQYDTGNVFVDQWSDAFQRLGHETQIVDFMSGRWQAQLTQAIDSSTDAVIAFNAIGSDLRFGRVSPYDEFDIRFIPVLINHPAHHLKRLDGCENQQIICTDQGHLNFLRSHGPATEHEPLFMPHGASVINRTGVRERPLDVVFCGTGNDPEYLRSLWKDLPESIKPIIHEIADVCLAEEPGCPDISAITEVFLSSAGIETGSVQHETVIALLPMIDSYLRAARRMEVLTMLDKQRIPVQIFGSGWEFAGFRQHKIHEAQPFQTLLETLASARVSLDISPGTAHGINERVLSSMAQGAAVITNQNTFTQESFEASELVACEWTERHRLPTLVASLLDSQSRCEEIAAAGQAKVLAEHTWEQRAGDILTILEREATKVSAA